MYILTFFFYFNTKFSPFSDKMFSKLPHFVVNFSSISKKQLCIEKVLKIRMPVKLKIFVDIFLNIGTVFFSRYCLTHFVFNQCLISMGTTLRFSFKKNSKETDGELILAKLLFNYIS